MATVVTFQDGGEIVIGAKTLTQVLEVNVEIGGEPEYTDITRSGDTEAQEHEGLASPGRVNMTVRLYDEVGLTSDVKTLLKNDASTKNVAIKLHPEGGDSGKPEQAWAGMTMTNKSVQYAAGRGRPPVAATLTFTGRATTEPAWTELP